jgi:hypothetical protein
MAKWSALLRTFLLVLLITISGAVYPLSDASVAATVGLAQADCQAAEAALAQVEQKILVHNAQPHTFEIPRQAAQLAAYNAEANALNAEAQTARSNLQACQLRVLQRDQALQELADRKPGSPSIPTPRADTLQKITDALAKLPPNYESPVRGPAPGGSWRVDKGTVLRPLFDVLRGVTPPRGLGPNVTLQGARRPNVGDRDPAGHPRNTIGSTVKGDPNVSPDHVIPLAEIMHMPGFLKLNPNNMYSVVNAPLNLQWMSRGANNAKGSKSAGLVYGFEPAWRTSQVALENQVRSQLRDIITRLLASQ